MVLIHQTVGASNLFVLKEACGLLFREPLMLIITFNNLVSTSSLHTEQKFFWSLELHLHFFPRQWLHLDVLSDSMHVYLLADEMFINV